MTPEQLDALIAAGESIALYERLGEKAAYVRQRGFAPLQHEQLISQFMESYGSISLQRLAKKGLVRPTKARGRGVRYEKATF